MELVFKIENSIIIYNKRYGIIRGGQKMTEFERFRIEMKGITATILSYSGKGKIKNYIDQLIEASDRGDKQKIIYCLSRIKEWYEASASEIANNGFVTPSEQRAHNENKKLIADFIKTLSAEDDLNFTTAVSQNEGMEEPVIFLSHKSDDKKYGDAIRDYIIGLGVKNESLIYTSHPLHKVPLDLNIYEYLRKNISGNVFVIILWSDKYLESPACLNEMGAAWVAQKDYTNIYVPSFSFGNPKYHECAVDTRKMGAVLNGDEHCKTSMIELKEKIVKMFNLVVDEKQSQFILDKFIEQIT